MENMPACLLTAWWTKTQFGTITPYSFSDSMDCLSSENTANPSGKIQTQIFSGREKAERVCLRQNSIAKSTFLQGVKMVKSAW